MASDISSGGSSKFLATRKFFRADIANAKDVIEVFVEDEIDTVFWRHFFAKYETENKTFRIRTLRRGNNILYGKDALITYVKLDSLGANKLLAIDSDYDYIIDNYHLYTNDLRNCKYAIHTHDTYSIENYKIITHILKEAVYLTSFCDNIIENIDDMILQGSNAYFQLFSIHLFSTNRKDNIYKQSDFKNDLSKLSFQKDTINKSTITHINKRLKSLSSYINVNICEYEKFITYLNSIGIHNYNCWQFMNGHDVLNELGIKIAASLACKYRGEYISWVNAHISEQSCKNTILSKFHNSTGVNNKTHKLKDRICEILYDTKPDMAWGPSIKNDEQIRVALHL